MARGLGLCGAARAAPRFGRISRIVSIRRTGPADSQKEANTLLTLEALPSERIPKFQHSLSAPHPHMRRLEHRRVRALDPPS